jgi:MFS family permease
MPLSRSNPLHARDRPSAPAHPARLILILSLGPTVGLGIGRFAYALVLPDMRDTLGWSYSAAGFMNTINAAGYLAGALAASRLIKRFGLAATVRWGTLACVLSLALCAFSDDFIMLSFARLLAGLGAAAGFVGGGALAATIAQSRPERANFLLSLFYAGPGAGILSSGLVAPFVLQAFGPGSWWIVWWAMTLLAVAMTVPLLLAPLDATASIGDAAATKFAIRPVLIYLIGYFCSAPDTSPRPSRSPMSRRRRGAAAQSAFWSLIASAPSSPWVWRRARSTRGLPRPSFSASTRSGGAADFRSFRIPAGDLGAGVRRRLFRRGRIDHRLRALQLSAGRMAGRHRGDDDRVRNRPDAGADRGRRRHGRDGQPVLCAERLGGDAGGGRDRRRVSGTAGAEIIDLARAPCCAARDLVLICYSPRPISMPGA